MGFGDLKKKEGLTALNEYLADKSYIEGSVVFTKFWYDYDIMKRGGGGGAILYYKNAHYNCAVAV